MQRVGRLRLADVEGKRRYIRVCAYSQAKLAVILLAYEFARRLEGTGVTSNALDPGFVATDVISRNAGLPWRAFQAVANLVAVTPQVGARTGIFLASSPDVAETTGQYFKKCRPVPSAPASYDQEAAERLWQLCSDMAGFRRG
jgi:NAD(P)-dependent dehydrogenase (short-subunit alcohol dehydrogenase family)